MKHAYRVKRNIGPQGWATVLNPVLPSGYPPQLALTRLGDLTEPAFPNTGTMYGVEYRESARERGHKVGPGEFQVFSESVVGRHASLHARTGKMRV